MIASPFGHDVVNDYEWLRDRSDPDVLAYQEAENAYADLLMARTIPLQRRLVEEFSSWQPSVAGQEIGAPIVKGRYEFVSRMGSGDYPVMFRRRIDGPEAPPEPVLDPDRIADGSPYFRLLLAEPSDDGEMLAYAVDLAGDERFALQVKDLRTGETAIRDRVHIDSAVWSSDGETLVYAEMGERPFGGRRLWSLHVPTSERVLLHDELDRSLYTSVRRSSDGTLFVLDLSRPVGTPLWSAVECRVAPAGDPRPAWKVLIDRSQDLRSRVDHAHGSLFIRVDDQGPYGRIVRASMDRPEREYWEELLPHRLGSAIDTFQIHGEHLVVTEWEDALCYIRVVDLSSGDSHRIPVPEPTNDLELIDPTIGSDPALVRFAYSSIVTPRIVVTHDLRNRTSTVVRDDPSYDHDPTRYETQRLTAWAEDGTKLPMSITRRKALDRGPGGVVLWGYGCYGVVLREAFEPERLSLLDRGVTFAVAHPRGSGGCGRPWHEAGCRGHKRTTWTDFVSAAEHLVAAGIAESGRIVILGASAGGALVTAATNLRPDLFLAVVALVPFTDPLHVQLDDSMPFTLYERDEWGDPQASEEEFTYLAGHCPFTNIAHMDYPAMYVTASLHDGQVPYWQPTKYVAKLRQMKADDNPLILRTNLHAGHLGSSRPDAARAERAEWYAFILDQLGLDRV